MAGPLEGVKVLSFGRVLSGPYAAMLMADMGADVIKIEDPVKGDLSRGNTPYIGDLSSYFLSVNRGKKSIAINLRDEKAKELIKKILPQMDILIENYRPGIMKKMGFDYDSVKQLNPRTIYVSISGFGQFGEYSQKPAYDLIAQSMGGTVSITGEPGRFPVRVGYSIGDIGAALYATVATMAALYERERTGMGQHIDVAMLDAQVAFCENAFARFFATGNIPQPIGTKHPLVAPFQIFPTQTDDMAVVTFKDEDWINLCKVIGKEAWIEDKRFNKMDGRMANYATLEPMLIEVFRQKTRDEWLALFEQTGVITSPVNNIKQVVMDRHVNSREMILEVKHKRLGKLKVVGTPMKFSRTPCSITKASPDLGEHTDEVLREMLGMSAEDILGLKENGSI
ncbi:MAG: CoA transferase [Syntrophaceae bacterium]|nr:CoA transferase [Syntrophaceae bacterium]